MRLVLEVAFLSHPDADIIKTFTSELVALLDMKTYGPCHVVHFGEDEKVAGFSMFQLIETSNISGHFANQSCTAYIDIFSCKPYNRAIAAKFCQDYFEGERMTYEQSDRK